MTKIQEIGAKSGANLANQEKSNAKSGANGANQKRVAIQFYGYLRSYAECRDRFFTHLVEPIKSAGYEVDIFMHSWDFVEGRVTSWHHEKTALDFAKPPKTPSGEYLKDFYKLKDIVITAQPTHNDSDKFIKMRCPEKGYRFQSTLSVYYSLHCVNHLRQNYEKQNGVEYDFVIVTRPDLLFTLNVSFDFLKYWGNISQRLFGYYDAIGNERGGIDLFYIAKPSVINILANYYKELNLQDLQNADLYSPESIMCNYLVAKSIDIISLCSVNRPFEILRTNDYKMFRNIVESRENEILPITRKEFDKLKTLEHLGGFLRFYTNKKLSHIRRKTRAIRYPIKRLFGFDK